MAARAELSASDAAFLLDALRHVVNPVVINAGEIASKKDAKVNTIAKRFSDIKRRYNINIQTTAAGYTSPKATAGVKVEKKARGRPPNQNRVKGPSARDAAVKRLLEEDEIPTQDKSATKSRGPAVFDAGACDEDFK